MGWIKANFPTKWHAKIKHYRDRTEADNLSDAVVSLVQRGLLSWESENEVLPENYEKSEHPVWDNNE